MEQFDVIVIGAGSAGLVAALTAHRRGLKTAMLEKEKVGGECTHSGCVPSKALIQATKQYVAAGKLDQYGMPSVQLDAPDFASVMNHVQGIIGGIYAHEQPEVFQQAGIETIVHPSGAKFLDPHTVQIGDRTLRGEHFVIATGSKAAHLPIPGAEGPGFLDNDSFWSLRTLPQTMVFIGGGVISAELGQAMSRLGSQVHILDVMPRILNVIEDDTAQEILPIFEREGIQAVGNAALQRFEREGDQIRVIYAKDEQARQILADAVFWAVGRRANVHGMDLEKAAVEFTRKGIQTNEYLQTSQPHIYACGDVTTPSKFTHTAAYQAEICIDNITFEEKRTNDLRYLPWAIFTDPEIAHVGLSEAQARQEHGDALQTFQVAANIDRYITDLKTGGFLKVLFDAEDRVVGAEAIGAHAGEWIQQLTLIMKFQLPAKELAQTIFAYPTYSEIVKKVFSRFMRTKGY